MFAFNDDHLSGLIGLAGFSFGGKSFLLGKNPAAPVLSPFGLSTWSQATHIPSGQKVLASWSSLSLSSASLLLSSRAEEQLGVGHLLPVNATIDL